MATTKTKSTPKPKPAVKPAAKAVAKPSPKAVKKPAAKPVAPKAKGKPAASGAKGKAAAYTKPELREKIKDKVMAGDKGGKPGQWSARKAQLVATEYKKEGGDYKEGGKSEGQKHLKSWTEEKWQTADGKPAIQGKTTSRYLPKKAWDKLSPEEKKATDEKKKTGSRTGKQFVANTAPAKKARKSSEKS